METFDLMFSTGQSCLNFLRIARSILLYLDFLPVASSLFKRMLNQGGSETKLLQQINKAISRHPEAFAKFSKSAKDIISDLKK